MNFHSGSLETTVLKKINQYNGDDSRIGIPVLRDLYTRAGPTCLHLRLWGQSLCTLYFFRSYYDMQPLLHLYFLLISIPPHCLSTTTLGPNCGLL